MIFGQNETINVLMTEPGPRIGFTAKFTIDLTGLMTTEELLDDGKWYAGEWIEVAIRERFRAYGIQDLKVAVTLPVKLRKAHT